VSTVIKPKRSETPNQIPGAAALAVHELAMNVTDGKLFTKTSGGVVKEVGGAGAVSLQTVTDGGAVTDNDITLNGANLIFEGYQENAYETTITVAEPTGDRTITFPDASGDVAMLGDSLAFSIVFGS
tara:strand:+ start:408 stop:788 length:381 start_codon:yes stop_codon:yes gene_type:complete